MKSKISVNLKKLLYLANVTPTELSRRTGIKQPIIHRLIVGENINPKLATIKPICDYFMITVSQLIGEENIGAAWDGLTSCKHEGWEGVPIISWNQIAFFPLGEDYSEYVFVDSEVTPEMFALTIPDESMEPVFLKNCKIVIDLNQSPSELDYVIARISCNIFSIRQIIIISDKKYITPVNRKSGTITELHSKDDLFGVIIQTVYQ